METKDPTTIDVDLDTPQDPAGTALQRSSVSTLTALSALKGEAVEVIEATTQVVHTLRSNGIRLTHPTDWLGFMGPDGQVTCFLDDAGCDRVRDLFGIEVFGVSVPEKIAGSNPGEFIYIVRGSGRAKFTTQRVENIEGARSSTDDFCKGVTGPALDVLVRKAARANLDGGVTRELAGMKNVPIEELDRCWLGTSKSSKNIRKGRGYGQADARADLDPTVPAPYCKVCNSAAVLRAGKNGGPSFWGCPNWKKHEDRKWTQDAKDWEKKYKTAQSQQPQPPQTAQRPAPAAAAAPAVVNPPDRKCDACGKVQSQHDSADHDFLGD